MGGNQHIVRAEKNFRHHYPPGCRYSSTQSRSSPLRIFPAVAGRIRKLAAGETIVVVVIARDPGVGWQVVLRYDAADVAIDHVDFHVGWPGPRLHDLFNVVN